MRAWLSQNKKWVLSGIVVAAALVTVYGLVAFYSQSPDAAQQPEEVLQHVLERQQQAEEALCHFQKLASVAG